MVSVKVGEETGLGRSRPFPRAAAGRGALRARPWGEGAQRAGSAVLSGPVAPWQETQQRVSATLRPYRLRSLSKPRLWPGKSEVGRQSWRRGRAGVRGGLQILSGSTVIIATHLPRGRIPPRAGDSCDRLFPPRLLHYVGRSLHDRPSTSVPGSPAPAAPS